ncbi:hypothetical protein E2320_015337 [Naja naja]|nr:hypothetical protein E2320_015337 [Naja naja]
MKDVTRPTLPNQPEGEAELDERRFYSERGRHARTTRDGKHLTQQRAQPPGTSPTPTPSSHPPSPAGHPRSPSQRNFSLCQHEEHMAPRFFLSALPTPALPPERRSRGAGAGRSELGCDRVAFLFAEAGRAIGLAEESERDAFWRSSCSHAET